MNEQNSRYNDTIYNEPYIVKDGCLYEQVTIKDQLVDVKFADFVPVLKAEITHDDGIEQRKLFLIAATYKTGLALPEQTVSADEMQSMKWLLQRWEQYGAVAPKQNVLAKVCHAIMQTKQPVRNETVFSQTGWRKIDGEWVFLMPRPDNDLTVELQGKLRSYNFTNPCSTDGFLHDYEQLTAQEVSGHTKVFDSVLLQSCSLNAEIIVNENPTTRFCEKLRSLLDSGRCYVETRGLEAQPRLKNCIGLQDSDHYYLFADAAHSEVRKLCTEQGEHLTISKNELLRQLRSEGLLLSRTSRNTISIRDNSNTVVNVAMLDKRQIEQRLSGDLYPPSDEVG
ncbi:hypothetical protein SAMN02910447_03122 [Ruminococcus sp. YE71]|uniref:hypothetical protein n=1 Tax=unclassified Ruminococcus TaxID=2608920 RepID=UPI00088DC359|nr:MULTISPECIES: hypothetical protein [unclassified Ruminococcus]SDA29950.1 hypothetical protein SAMN02910446_03193 [Ruminococcus sp. YE78]SFW49048.1 hypothetical protein SAMN02910447_03122 [Ruminococcus sp. YE71]